MNRPTEDELRRIRENTFDANVFGEASYYNANTAVRVLFTEFDALRSELEAERDRFKESIPCAICGKPVIFEFTVESAVWNRIVRAKGLPEYLCFWCFDRLADEEKVDRRIPVGVNINGIVAFSNWCEEDVPNAYPNEKTKAQLRFELEAARAETALTKRQLAETKDAFNVLDGIRASLDRQRDQLRRELELLRTYMRDTCEEMECLPKCDSFGHEEMCPLTNTAAAWRQLRRELAETRENVEYLAAYSGEQEEFLRIAHEGAARQIAALEKQLAESREIESVSEEAIANLAVKQEELVEYARYADNEIERLLTREQRYMPNRDDFYLSAEDLDRLINEAEPRTDLGYAVKDLLLAHYMGNDAERLHAVQHQLLKALDYAEHWIDTEPHRRGSASELLNMIRAAKTAAKEKS